MVYRGMEVEGCKEMGRERVEKGKGGGESMGWKKMGRERERGKSRRESGDIEGLCSSENSFNLKRSGPGPSLSMTQIDALHNTGITSNNCNVSCKLRLDKSEK